MFLPCFCLWISWDTSTPSTPEPAVERHQKFWPHMPSCMRASQHFCLSQWSLVTILWSIGPKTLLDVCHESVGKHMFTMFFCLLISMLFNQCFTSISYSWKNWVVFKLKDTPNPPSQLTWPLPRCHSSIERGAGSVSVGVWAPSAGVLAATTASRTDCRAQPDVFMCLCQVHYGHQKCFVGYLFCLCFCAAGWWCW